MGVASRSPFQDMKMRLALETSDIGGIGAAKTSAYFSLAEFGAITFIIQLGDKDGANWHADDILDTCKLKQATNTAAGSAKDITGAEIDTDLTTVGDVGALTVRANALDIANDFDCVACYVAELGNSGVDYVTIFAVLHDAHYHYTGHVNAYKIVG